MGTITLLVCSAARSQDLLPQAGVPDIPDVPAVTTKGYVDRVMDTTAADSDALQLKLDTFDESGWSRGWRIEVGTGVQRGISRTQNDSIAISGFFETPDYGIFSVNANRAGAVETIPGNVPRSNAGTTWRIDQRGLALNGGWVANHSVGNVGTTGVPLSRGLSRTTVPTTPIRGLAGQWSLADVVDINASVGEVGAFAGFDLSGFRPTGSHVASAGAQLRLNRQQAGADRTYAAVQFIDVRQSAIDPQLGGRQNTQGIYAAVSTEGRLPWAENSGRQPSPQEPSERVGGFRLQGNFLRSNQMEGGQATGVWADAQWRTEKWRQTAGVFRFDPLLRWGEALLASNLQGLYWRADTATRQWQFTGTGELSNAVTHGNAASAFFSSSVRYRVDSRNTLNTTINLRRLTNPASSVNLSWNQQNAIGQTQWLSEVASFSGLRTMRFGAEQSLNLSAPSTLSASLVWEQTTGNLVAPVQGWTWGLLGSLSPASGVVLDGSLRGSQRSDGTSALDANVALSWQLGQGWSAALRYAESRGQQAPTNLLASALTTALLPPAAPSIPFRSVLLTLRYEGRAGSSSRPIGGVVGEGAGSVKGTVFFDADGNGQREASEGGVPGITVVLDRKYVTTTDAQGRYSFAYVAAKNHLIEISADNLPLPWNSLLREPVSIDVLVRTVTTQDFAVQRER